MNFILILITTGVVVFYIIHLLQKIVTYIDTANRDRAHIKEILRLSHNNNRIQLKSLITELTETNNHLFHIIRKPDIPPDVKLLTNRLKTYLSDIQDILEEVNEKLDKINPPTQ